MMWLFFSDGFLSIVAHRDLPDHLLVRSRNARHLKSLFPNAEHYTIRNADYPYRANVPRKAVADMLVRYVMAMNYDNYKNSVNDSKFKETCNIIWSVMYQYGEEYRRQTE